MDIILGIIVSIVILYFIFRKKKTTSPPPVKQEKSSKPKHSKEKDLYKKKGIKNYNVVGVKHYKLNPEEFKGGGKGFTGYITTVKNLHDKYAVGVFDSNGKQLGHTPKNNSRLFNSLQHWHEGKSIAWGYLRYDDYIENWEGTVYSPVGYPSEEMEKIETIIKLREEIKIESKNTDNTTEGYFKVIEKHKVIQSYLESLKHPSDLNYSLPANFIPTVSKHLEKEKEWERLIELEKHDDLINQLNDRFKATTLRRIKKAKNKVST